MPENARTALKGPPEHVGVWLDRCYFPECAADGKDKSQRRALYETAIKALRPGQPAAEAYKPFFERWKREARLPEFTHRTRVIEAKGRVLLHPASNASVTDGSVLLHHTYGVPYLPGSGLKGIARAWMHRTVAPEVVRALFGHLPREGEEGESQGQGAVVEFLDALWVPEAPSDAPPDWSPLALDVVNPHHSSYYTGNAEPSDANEPIPTHRLSAAPGTRFLVTVQCAPMRDGKGARVESEAWADFVLDQVLSPALESMGFGAWTSAGYGRFAMQPPPPPPLWYTVTVTLAPNSGKLSAQLPGPGRRMAEAHGPDATRLRERLSPELRDRLNKKRSLQLRVRVEPYGTAWSIVELEAE